MNSINALHFNQRVPKLQTQQRKQRNYQNLRPAYEAMNWKNYTLNRPRNISLEDVDRMSAKTSVRQHQSPSVWEKDQFEPMNAVSSINPKRIREQNLRLSGVSYSNKRQQHATRVKQDAIRRVKMLQQKVLPLISTEKNPHDSNQEFGLAWQLKMEQRLVKIQNNIEKVKNEVEIKYQKRLMEIERQWEERIGELLEMMEGNEGQAMRQEMNGSRTNGEEQIMNERYELVNGNHLQYNYVYNGYSNGYANEAINRYEDQQQHINGGITHHM